MKLGYSVKEMILITINTTFIVLLLAYYWQTTGIEAQRKRAELQVEKDTKIIVEQLMKDIKLANKHSIEMVLISEKPPTVKISMQIYLEAENKMVPVTYYMLKSNFSRIFRRKKKVLSTVLFNLIIQNDPTSGEFQLEATCLTAVEGLEGHIVFTSRNSVRPLEAVPEDVIVETEEGLEVDTSSGDEETADGESAIDMYLKYSEMPIIELQKEQSDINGELDTNNRGIKTVNEKLSNEIPGIKHTTLTFTLPEINDPTILEQLTTINTIAPEYREHI
jgi:hypothetical protein